MKRRTMVQLTLMDVYSRGRFAQWMAKVQYPEPKQIVTRKARKPKRKRRYRRIRRK